MYIIWVPSDLHAVFSAAYFGDSLNDYHGNVLFLTGVFTFYEDYYSLSAH